jgi:PAS domain S-box-containing protein
MFPEGVLGTCPLELAQPTIPKPFRCSLRWDFQHLGKELDLLLKTSCLAQISALSWVIRYVRVIFLIYVIAWTSLAAQEAPELAKVTLQLKWFHQFQFAGYYAAKAKGFYREAGLEVELAEGRPAINSVDQVLSGKAEYGVGTSSLLLERNAGKPVVVLAVIYQHSPFVLLARRTSPTQTVQDLVGKRLMLEPGAEELVAYLRKEGVTLDRLTLLKHSFETGDLISGKADVISGYVTDDPDYLDQARFAYYLYSPRSAGIDFYGDNLFTTERELREHPNRVRDFRRASLRGWQYAMAHPEEIADLILANYSPKHNRDHLLFQARQMTALIRPDLVEPGYMLQGRWRHIAETYADLGMLPKDFRFKGFLYEPQAEPDLGWVVRSLAGAILLLILAAAFQVHRANRRLSAAKEFSEGLIEGAHVLVVGLDDSGRILLFNETAERITGYSRKEVVGSRSIAAAIPPDQFPAVWEQFKEFRASGALPQEIESPLLTKAGELRLVSWRNSPAPTPNLLGVTLISFGIDVTERKRAEEGLRASEALYRELFERRGEGFSMVDAQERFLVANPVAETIFGVAPGGLLGRSLMDFLPPDQRDLVRGETLLRSSGADSTYELQIQREDGSIRTVLVTATPRNTQTGDPLEVIGMFRDITEHKQAQEQQQRLHAQLQQTQKMESLGSLAGGVAHDMNNVLGAILGLASANIGTQPPGSPTGKALATIIKAAERGGKMVKGLLGFARQSPAEEQHLDLNLILREEVQLLDRTTLLKVRLEMDLAEDLWPILGDASALTHAFMNLCVNAVDAMPGKGTLSLRTRNVDEDWIEVVVEDNGCGMPQEVLEKALDPFFTTKEQGKGTGLGLSMVFTTVKAHHGQMEIESEPGQGTRVRIRFPACTSVPMETTIESEPRLEPAKGKLCVLLVDDDELIQSSMQAILDVLGHSVVTVCCGEDALTKLEEGMQPDVVILDMNMPGLGGSGTLPRLRVLRPTLPVLLATGRADQSALNLVSAHPRVTLLSKPFSLEELQKHLELLARGREAAS